MRPESLRKFDLFYIAAIGIGVASGLLNYDTQVRMLESQLAPSGMQGSAEVAALTSVGVAFLFNLILWFLASRMRVGLAKWLIVALVAFSLLMLVVGLTSSVGIAGMRASVSITGLITVLLKAIAVSFLFRPDAKAWFAGRAE
ncbi:hypothetical protein [Erythrobacter sp. EC-HK427]|uniref:hypothetical protein n=1 Tax=Erythrobacter sp. EC-HK427 TaxID=2038396 RepID=UPI001253AC47|nr:hypothetical protein [Erythrobacter sp. EC-HK427]VVT02861.1 conserved membrane hypothetical protein [Erythrobacter sp. EC-HK427]